MPLPGGAARTPVAAGRAEVGSLARAGVIEWVSGLSGLMLDRVRAVCPAARSPAAPLSPLVNHRVMVMLMAQAGLHTVRGGGHLVLLGGAEQMGLVITSFGWEG